jgi:hypothetical protein
VNPFARPKPKTRALLRGKRALSFDGNTTDDIRHWVFASEEFPEQAEEVYKELIDHLAEDRLLNWVMFPPEGYRL